MATILKNPNPYLNNDMWMLPEFRLIPKIAKSVRNDFYMSNIR